MRINQRLAAGLAAAGLMVAACGSDGPDPDIMPVESSDAAGAPSDASSPVPVAGAACGEGRPVNAAEVVAAAAFQPPWVEKDPRGDGAESWVSNVEQFPTDKGFEPPDPAAVADVTSRGLAGTRNRQFEILGPDPEAGTDDAFAVVFAGDFGTCEQAAAATEVAVGSALGAEGATEVDPGIVGARMVTWTYSISKCTPNGFEVECEEQPPSTVFHVLAQVDRYAVLVSVQWPDGSSPDPSEAVALAEDLIENFGQ